MEAPARPRPRFWTAIQPSIVKVYKVAGMIALTAILIGLLGFLVTNIFYFFDHTWVRPVVLSPNDQKVVEASTQLADAKLRASQLETEKVEIDEQLAEIARTIAADDKFLGEAAAATTTDWQLRRELDRVKLEKDNADGKRAPLGQRLASLKLRQAEQDAVVKRLENSPYLRAVNSKLVLAFVPYQNRANVKIGTKLYGCAWGLVACRTVGKVTGIIDSEVTGLHPHDESAQRGIMVEIDVSSSAAGDKVLFAGGKPLWLF